MEGVVRCASSVGVRPQWSSVVRWVERQCFGDAYYFVRLGACVVSHVVSPSAWINNMCVQPAHESEAPNLLIFADHHIFVFHHSPMHKFNLSEL